MIMNWKILVMTVCASAGILLPAVTPVTKEDAPGKADAGKRMQAGKRHRPEGRRFRRAPKGPHKNFFARLTPEERSKVTALIKARKKDELRKYMQGLMYKYRPQELKDLESLSAKYQAAKDDREKAAIKARMKPLAQTLFRKRQEYTRNNILHTERQLLRAKRDLERLKKRYEHSRANEAKLIDRQVEYFCLPPEKRRQRLGFPGPKKHRRPAQRPGPEPGPVK